MQVSAGIKVRARGLVWDVVAADPSGPENRLRLRCCSGDMAGLEWDILHPFEPVDIARLDPDPAAVGSAEAWRLHHIACLLDQRPGPAAMMAAAPGRVTIEAYQFVPLMRALEMPRPRLLLADGVGLGKTVQACLIATELIARRQAHRILVVTPAGPLLAQWARELTDRFGLRPTIIADAAALRAQRHALELGGNPFDTMALCLTSLDFAKQDAVLQALERSTWDLVIIDEAHHCAGSAVTAEREETQRRRLAEVLAERSDGLLLLSATPHDGDDARFASLVALLDPSLVDGTGRLLGLAYRRHVIRRLKAHLRDPATGRPLFRNRVVTPVAIDVADAAMAPARAFHRALSDFVAPRLRRSGRARHPTDSLAFVGLLKRSVSTIAACVATLRVIADRYDAQAADDPALRRERARALRLYRRRLARYGVLDPPAEQDQARLEADGMAAVLRDDDADATALRRLITAGEHAVARDPKLDALGREIRLIRAGAPDANILVYTEYADSQDTAVAWLRADPAIAGDILAISGRDPEPVRAITTDRFGADGPIVLVSTDSLAEGLNLQRRCHHLLHLDLPYNPNRLEQRNGRIDRYGQAHDPDIRYLYLPGTFEERVLLRLIAKYEHARAALDAMPDTLGVTADADALAAPLVQGFAEEQARLFPPAPSPIRTLDRMAEDLDADIWRDMLREIDRAYDGFEPMAVRHGWASGVGLNADPRLLAGGAAAHDAARAMTGGIDPARFVAAAIRADGGRIDGETWHLPPAWLAGPEATLHVTGDPARMRDADGHPLAWLGSSHTLLRRAIDRVRKGEVATAAGRTDSRVAAVRSAAVSRPAALLTYAIEIQSARRLEWRRVIGVRLARRGTPAVLTDAAAWLAFAEAPDAAGRPWHDVFAAWLPARMDAARAAAAAALPDLARDFTAAHRDAVARETAWLDRWLSHRAAGLCGAWSAATPDLFGFIPARPAWKTHPDTLERLAAFAADAANPPDRRQQARSVVAYYTHRVAAAADRARLTPPRLLPVGLLLLLPA